MHYEKHMLPFLANKGTLNLQDVKKQKGNIRFLQYDHPSGHAAEPKEMLPEIFVLINYMIENVSYSKNKFLILGSCVSRDVFLPKYRSEIGSCGYYPRTSFARLSFEKVNKFPDLSNLSSPFQRKIVTQDLNLDLFDTLINTDYDYILIDLIDDRYGLVKFENTFVTKSFEFDSSKILDSNCEINTVSFFSKDFYFYWEKGFKLFLDFCILNNIESKLVLNKVYFADSIDNGKNFNNFTQSQIENYNSRLDEIYDLINDLVPNLIVIDYPQNIIIAKSNHKWGEMPFHYIDEFYDWTYSKLSRL